MFKKSLFTKIIKMASGDETESTNDSHNRSFLLLNYLDSIEDSVENVYRKAQDLSQERDTLMTLLSELEAESNDIAIETSKKVKHQNHENDHHHDDKRNDYDKDDHHSRLNLGLDVHVHDHEVNYQESESGNSNNGLNGHCQEIQSSIERLKQRLLNIEIKVHTVRTDEQQHSYFKVNSLIKRLEHVCLDGDPDDDSFRKQAKGYLNACLSDMQSGGPVDYRFQGMILDCKLEDQKQVRQRLECLVQGRIHEKFIENVLRDKAVEIEDAGNTEARDVEM